MPNFFLTNVVAGVVAHWVVAEAGLFFPSNDRRFLIRYQDNPSHDSIFQNCLCLQCLELLKLRLEVRAGGFWAQLWLCTCACGEATIFFVFVLPPQACTKTKMGRDLPFLLCFWAFISWFRFCTASAMLAPLPLAAPNHRFALARAKARSRVWRVVGGALVPLWAEACRSIDVPTEGLHVP